jgi:glycosyltransferase involved in cell wall biosynthesis
MKLLITTQAIDTHHPVLGFFHEWVAELAKHFEHITVICLIEGEHTLPDNVTVYSLGKEKGELGRIAYARRFLHLLSEIEKEYDAVFVHMNEEYVLLAGWYWRYHRKPVYMWRNHYAGSFLTGVAVAFCKKVFCTSMRSYTARYKRTMLMPVGVDIERFSEHPTAAHTPHSILFLSRMAPSKRPDMFIEALGMLKSRGVTFSATLVGSPTPEDQVFYSQLREHMHVLGLDKMVEFRSSVEHKDAPTVFENHEIFVNTSRTGMFDKTIFEAAASGCLVLASSEDFKNATSVAFYFTNAEGLADKLQYLLTIDEEKRKEYRAILAKLVRDNTLLALVSKLVPVLTQGSQ